jgi:hypothetical protein
MVICFASRVEYRYWAESLSIQHRAGQIEMPEFHPTFRFPGRRWPPGSPRKDVLVRADFGWQEAAAWRVVDVKAAGNQYDPESLRNHRLVGGQRWRWTGEEFHQDPNGEEILIEVIRWE